MRAYRGATAAAPVWAIACALAALFTSALVCAQERFPARPIDIVTHASPGGGTDTTARALATGARRALGVDIAVVPRTGGGGLVALSYVAGRPRDGHTILAITPTHLFAIARGQSTLEIDDLVPLARATDDPIVITVRAGSGIDSLQDLIELGRERPIKWGTTQIGGVDHIAGAAFAKLADTRLSVVPFAGGGEIVTNLIGRNIDAAGLNLTEALDQIERGQFRALAVMAERRLDPIPNVPTATELGYELRFSTVRGYVVLAGTPEERVQILEQGLLAGLRDSAYQSYLAGAGLDAGSVAGREVWGTQLDRLYRDARAALLDLGIIEQ